MTYKCDVCGTRVAAENAFQITKFFNGMEIPITICNDCIAEIGQTSPEEEADSE